MSAETLRRAASLMRERAEAATASPWASESVPTKYAHREGMVRTHHADFEDCADEVAETLDHADAEHIASWHPAVALAVADWLDSSADLWEAGLKPIAYADDVARAYLGGGVS